MSNFRGKVPQKMWPEIKAELEAIRDAANYKQSDSPLKLVYGVLIRASARWRRV